MYVSLTFRRATEACKWLHDLVWNVASVLQFPCNVSVANVKTVLSKHNYRYVRMFCIK